MSEMSNDRNISIENAIADRRSKRTFFKGASVEELVKLIELGEMAPSPKNSQPWKFILMNESETARLSDHMINQSSSLIKKAMSETEAKKLDDVIDTAHSFKNASLILILLKSENHACLPPGKKWNLSSTDSEAARILSLGMCAQNIMLGAFNMGYGSLPICDFYNIYDSIIEYLNVDSDFPIMLMIAVGIADDNSPTPPRKPLEETIVQLDSNM